MKTLFFVATLLLGAGASFAQNSSVDQILGTWQSEDSEDVQLKFEIFKSKGKYGGKLLWASDMFEADGKMAKQDFNNPDEQLRGRSRKGIPNITGLTYEDGEYTGGKLYNPENGNTYSLQAKLANQERLELRGYMGISLLGKTMKLTRVP